MYVSDTEVQVITEIIGNVYTYWNDLFNSGITNNNSFDFLLRQSIDFLSNKKIIYTVNSSSDLEVSKSTDTSISISDGYVINSSNSIVKFIEQILNIDHLYSYNYDENGYYGVIIGVYYSDIENSSDVIRSYTTQSISSGDTKIYIKDISIFNNFTFPMYLQINSESILISSINMSGSYANISNEYNSNNGIINSYSNSSDIFIYAKLEAKMIFGAPVSSSFLSSEDASDFHYYSPVPDDMLLLAKILVKYPVTPDTYDRNSIGSPLDGTEIISIDTSVKTIGGEAEDIPFTSEQQSIISNYYNSMINLKNLITFNASLFAFCDAINKIQFDDIQSYNYSGSTFVNYWNHRPMIRANYLQYGIQWDDFERFETSEGFKKLWYDWSGGTQLLTTLGLFSGNLMDSRFTSGVDSPVISSVSATVQSDPVNGAVGPGTWSYAVTSVTNSGESPLSDFVSVSIPFNKPYNSIDIAWNAIPGAIYYNIYKRVSNSSIINDLKITDDNQIVSNSFIDLGNISNNSKTTRRGVILTGKTIYNSSGSALFLYIPQQRNISSLVPIISLQDSIGSSEQSTQNGIILTLTLKKPDGTIEDVIISVPSGTVMGTSISINNGILYSELLDIKISIIDGDVNIIGSRINWSYKDVIMIQNI